MFTILRLTCLYEEKKELLWVPGHPSGVFSQQKKLPLDHRFHLGWESFTELFLSNIMKYGNIYIEWHTNIQGMSLGDFGDYLTKEKEA